MMGNLYLSVDLTGAEVSAEALYVASFLKGCVLNIVRLRDQRDVVARVHC